MKLKLMNMLAIVLAFQLQGQEAKITVHVTDENGVAVSNAQVNAGFNMAIKPGEGWGTGIPTEVAGITDTNGICILTGKDTAGSVGVAASKEGYYGNGGGTLFTNLDLVLRRWETWNPTIDVVLLKKGIQAPMYARKMREIKIPVEETPVGFDLIAGDWVTPYGKGEVSDFIFQVDVAPTQWITNWYGTSPRPYPIRDNKIAISFSNGNDGIQTAAALPYGLRLPRQAPLDGYKPVLTKRAYSDGKSPAYSDFQKDANYFFRVRTKKDEQGNIISALYGKIYGEFNNSGGIGDKISFTYYLNPEPNSRNMEFDPKQNLFKNLKPLERVTAP